jgi:imidazolonepropionase-like amidohydrolase
MKAVRRSRFARGLITLLALATLPAVTLAQSAAPERVALKGARIIPIAGPEIEEGTVLVERGTIKAVGQDVEIPYDARVFNCKGKVVMPGLIHAHASSGMGWQDEPRPVTPQVDVLDGINPADLFWEDSLRNGVTAVLSIPGNNTVFGGLGRVVRPIGMLPEDMLISDAAYMKVSVSPRGIAGGTYTRGGEDRMVQRATLRETMLKHRDWLAALAERRYEEHLKEENGKLDVGPAEARARGLEHIRAEDIDEENKNLLRLTGGQVKVDGKDGPRLFDPINAFVYVEDAMDVAPAVQIAKEYGFFDRLVFVLGVGAYRAIDELKAAARPVVLPAELTHREVDPFTGEIRETFVPKRIADAGLVFAIIRGPDLSLPERMLNYQAAVCVRGGVSRDVALRAITLDAARTLGLDARMGSIEAGKDANLLVLSGDPLELSSLVERVFIDGIPAYDRSRDPRLNRLLSTQPAPTGRENDE